MTPEAERDTPSLPIVEGEAPSPTTTQEVPPLCKHWARRKSCLYHSQGKCRFSHPEDYVVPPPKLDNQHRRSSHQTNLHNRHRTSGGRLLTRNDARVAIFRAFIASQRVDLENSNVLDVAGGKGELAFQLLNLNNVQTCHVIDPRPLSLGKFQKRRSKGFYHRSQGILQHDIIRSVSENERPVDQLRCLFSSELWEENNSDTADQRKLFFKNCYMAQGWVWPPIGVDEHAAHQKQYSCKNDDDDDDECEQDNQLERTTTTEEPHTSAVPIPEYIEDAMPNESSSSSSFTPTFNHASQVVKNADLIVGMHPDQAVDAIIDAALAMNISFFVVPCCVYSKEFPFRRIHGNHVRTYNELIDYLQAKSSDIQKHILPFEGRNICLYRVVG